PPPPAALPPPPTPAAAAPPVDAPPAATAAAPARPARWRRIVVPLCVFLGCVLAALSVAATWLKLTALDTATYADTVAPLTKDPNVSLAISTRVVDDVFSKVDVESLVQDVLPSQASALAPALVAVLQRYAVQLLDDVIQSDQFQRIWETANRVAHTQ